MQHNRMVILFTTLIIAAIIVGIQCNETKDTRDPMITEESVKTLTTNMAYSSRDQNSARFMSQTTQNRPTTSTSSSSNLKASSSSFFNMEPVGLTAQESGKMYKRSGRYWNDEHVPEYGHSMANERMPEYRHLRNNEHIPEYRHSRNNEHVPEYRHPSNNEQSHYGYNAPNPSMGHDYLEQEGYVKGKEISITPEPNKPITLHYRTHSQPITIHQTRIPGPKPEVKHSTSHEEPHRVVHEVIRPIIQEVHEIIMPYRRVVQEVKPVIEEVHTVIAKNSGKGAPAYSGNSAANVNAGDGNAQYEPKYDNNMINGGETRQIPRKLKYIQERQQTSSSENNETIMLPRNVVQRSKVFISKQGIPIYQSNYMGPALLHS